MNKYVYTIGAESLQKTFELFHGLNTTDVFVTAIDAMGQGTMVDYSVWRDDRDKVTVYFSSPPVRGTKIMVIG